MIDRIVPAGSRRRSVARFLLRSIPGVLAGSKDWDDEVLKTSLEAGRPWTVFDWFERYGVTEEELTEQRRGFSESNSALLASIHIEGDSETKGWSTSIESLNAQSYSAWNAVAEPAWNAVAEPAWNAAAESESEGDFVVALRAGEQLTPDALFRISEAFGDDERVRAVCFDEIFDDQTRRPQARVGPTWSPLSLCSENLWGSGVAWRKGEMDPAEFIADPAEALRTRAFGYGEVTRVPAVLKTSSVWEQQSLVSVRSIVGELSETEESELPSVCLVVLSRFSQDLLQTLIAGIVETDYPNFEVVVVDNSGQTDYKSEWYMAQFGDIRNTILWDEPDRDFNYSRANNRGAKLTQAEILVFMNDDLRLDSPTWLSTVAELARQPNIGITGAQMLDANGLIQHGGVVMGINGLAEHLFYGATPVTNSMLGSAMSMREVTAVTGALLAVRRDVFEELGGFDENLRLTGSDVDLCIRCADRGSANVVVPSLGVTHDESATRGEDSITDDVFLSWWKFQPTILSGDRHFHPNLSMVSHTPAPLSPIEQTPVELLATHLRRSDIADMWSAEERVLERVATMAPTELGERTESGTTWLIPDSNFPDGGASGETLRLAEHFARTGGNHRVLVVGCDNRQWAQSIVSHCAPSVDRVSAVGYDPTVFAQLRTAVVTAAGLETLVSGPDVTHVRENTELAWAGLDTLPPGIVETLVFSPSDVLTVSSDVALVDLPATRSLEDMWRSRRRVNLMAAGRGLIVEGSAAFERRCAAEALLSGIPVALDRELGDSLGLGTQDYISTAKPKSEILRSLGDADISKTVELAKKLGAELAASLEAQATNLGGT